MRYGLAAAVVLVALGACVPGESGDKENGTMTIPSSSASAPAAASPTPMSPSQLPTITRTTAPPSSPTDVPDRTVVAGRVFALTDTCTDVTTDDAVTWSLVGERDVVVAIGNTVIARVADLNEGDVACGDGRPARLVSIRLVGE